MPTPLTSTRIGRGAYCGSLCFTINNSTFAYGDFINYLIAFISIAAAVFFFVVVPVNKLMASRAKEDPDTKECPECTSAIPTAARRCPQCTSQLLSS
jgi:large conductance mechanosensitive channel